MWPTPTPIPTQPPPTSLPFDPTQVSDNFISWMFQGWHMFDTNPIATLVWFLLLAFIIFVGVMRIRRYLESL